MTISADLFASTSPRFPLAGSTATPSGGDLLSSPGLRPWCLRRARPAGSGRVLPPWTYDHDRRLAVDVTGRLLIDTIWGDPSASATSSTDGEDGPSYEDLVND